MIPRFLVSRRSLTYEASNWRLANQNTVALIILFAASRLLKFTLSQGLLHPILLGLLILPKVNTATVQGLLQNAMMLSSKRTTVMRGTEIDFQTTQTSIIQKPYR